MTFGTDAKYEVKNELAVRGMEVHMNSLSIVCHCSSNYKLFGALHFC